MDTNAMCLPATRPEVFIKHSTLAQQASLARPWSKDTLSNVFDPVSGLALQELNLDTVHTY